MERSLFPAALQNFYLVKNPDKIKMERLDKFTGYMNDEVSIGSKKNLPIGAYYWAYQRGFNLPPVAPLPKPVDPQSKINLYPEQLAVFNDVKDFRSFLVDSKTGSGKTVMIARLTEYWGNKTLILAHNSANVSYIAETIETFTGQKCGMYYTHKKDIQDITVTTFHSATAKSKLFEEYGFDNIVVDEADAFFSDKRRNWLTDFPAVRKCGFTGTIKTDLDEFEPATNVKSLVRYYGKHCIGSEDQSKNVLEDIYFTKYDSEGYFDDFAGIKVPVKITEWQLFRERLDEDMSRKHQMIDYIYENLDPEDRALVLFDRVNDVEWFHETIRGSWMIHGKVSKKKRDQAKEEFLSKGGVLVAQKATSGRGVDYPECNKVFILYPMKKENELRQIVGRAIRYLPGKKSYIYDWVDPQLQHQFRDRKKVYKEIFDLSPKLI